MARHDQHERIARQRLRHRMRGAGSLELRGDLAIGQRFAARDGPREVVDPGVERPDAGHIEPDLGEIGRLAAQQRHDAVDGALDFRGRAEFAGLGKQLEQPPPGFDLARLGQLHAQNAQLAPCDAASADRRIEYRVPTP